MGSRNKTAKTFTPRPSHQPARTMLVPTLCCSYCKSGPHLRVFWMKIRKKLAHLICPVCDRLFTLLGKAVRKL